MATQLLFHSTPEYRAAMARYHDAVEARHPDTMLCEGLWLDVLAAAADTKTPVQEASR